MQIIHGSLRQIQQSGILFSFPFQVNGTYTNAP